MPIYVYERHDGSRFEVRQGFNDPHLTEDPQTGAPVRRVVLAPPVIFKGSGWYKTDSRATTNNASATSEPVKTDGAESTAAKEPAAKTEGAAPAAPPAAKAEAKTEAKTEKSSAAAAS